MEPQPSSFKHTLAALHSIMRLTTPQTARLLNKNRVASRTVALMLSRVASMLAPITAGSHTGEHSVGKAAFAAPVSSDAILP
jgi:hypothetical protein